MYLASPLSIPTANVARWTRLDGGEALPVSLDAVKDFTARPRQDTFWDDELTRFVRAAQSAIERECQLCLTPCSWRGDLPELYERIRLIKRPFLDVTGIDYVATDGTVTTLDTDLYHVQDEPQMIGMLYVGEDAVLPATARRRDAVRVTLKAGYALTDEDEADGHPALPEELHHAVLMTVAALEKARGDTEASTGNVTVYAMKNSRGGGLIPPEAMALIATYKYRMITVA